MYGKHPRKPIDLTAQNSITPAAEDYILTVKKTIARARENIIKAQSHQKTQADKHRRDHQFKIDDLVYLSTKNLTLSTPNKKLSPRWVGPFKIVKKINKDAFELDLQGKFRAHPVFHSSLLKPYIRNDDTKFPKCDQLTPPPIAIDGQEEYEVDAILNHRKRHGKMEYLVKWKHYHEEDSSWESEDNLSNAKKIVDRYHKTRSRAFMTIRSTPSKPEISSPDKNTAISNLG
jgi:hypothetical protein